MSFAVLVFQQAALTAQLAAQGHLPLYANIYELFIEQICASRELMRIFI